MDTVDSLRLQYDLLYEQGKRALDLIDEHLRHSKYLFPDIINGRIDDFTDAARSMYNAAVAIRDEEEAMIAEHAQHEADVQVGLQQDAEADLSRMVDRLAEMLLDIEGCPPRDLATWCPQEPECAFTDEADDDAAFDAAVIKCWKEVARNA